MASIRPRQQRLLRQKSLSIIYYYAFLRSLETKLLRPMLASIWHGALCVLKAPPVLRSVLRELWLGRNRVLKGAILPMARGAERVMVSFAPTRPIANRVVQVVRVGRRLPALLQYGEADPATYLVFDDRASAYLVMSKVACTSIRLAIGKAYAIHVHRPMLIHDASLWNIQKGQLKGSAAAHHSFTFVRNPFERLVSCYRDRVLYDGPTETLRRPYFSNYAYRIPANITFAEFVRIVARIPDWLADRHFKSQVSTLYRRGRCRVDFIGRFENLEEDWKTVANRFGFDAKLPPVNRSGAASGAHDYRAEYTPELVEIVYQRYKKDVDLLRYGDAYRELATFVRSAESTDHHE